MADFNHTDYTPELNRIITALTGIRDDIRLLRTLQEDPESGIVTSNVLNDFQRALLTVTLGSAGSNTAAAVAAAIDAGDLPSGRKIAAATGDSNAELAEERAGILNALGQDPETQRVLIRVNGQYYWEAEGTAGPDDGLRGPVVTVEPFAIGEQLGFDDEVSGSIISGAPSGPPDQIPNPSKPRKRWPFTRPEGQTASQNANSNADLIDPATGEVVARSLEEQNAADRSGSTPPPAVEYTPEAGE